MKIWEIVKNDFEPQQPIEEGWKENVLATVISVAGLFGNIKAQNGGKTPTNVSVNQQVKNDSIKLDIGKMFRSGKYRFSEQDDKLLASELRKLGDIIIKNPTADFAVEVVSSESKVTNYDMEPTSPTYKQKLGVGQLAQKRAETAKFVIANFINELKKEGILKGGVNLDTPPKILVGDTPWPMANKKADDPEYTKDQYVYVNIKIIPKKLAKETPFSAYAHVGQPIYSNNKMVGMLFMQSRDSKNITQGGNKDTGHENILFRMTKPDTPLSGEIGETGVYTKSFVIPFKWWNQNITHKTLTPEQINYIVKNFKSVDL